MSAVNAKRIPSEKISVESTSSSPFDGRSMRDAQVSLPLFIRTNAQDHKSRLRQTANVKRRRFRQEQFVEALLACLLLASLQNTTPLARKMATQLTIALLETDATCEDSR